MPNFDVTEAALIGEGPVLAQPWWERTTLTKVQSLPNQPAIYCIYDSEHPGDYGISPPAK
jgi:hypothetical protein